MKLTEQLYWYPWQGRANNCNSYLLKGKHTILFDPGHINNELNENCLDRLLSGLSADGFELSALDFILCTHGHPDHVDSAGIVRQKSGAVLAMHRGDEFIIEALAQHFKSGSDQELPVLKPDTYLEEGPLNLEPAGGPSDQIEVLHTPGHSPGSVCFYLPGQQALISGDTIFTGSIGRADLPGGDMQALGQSVEKLAGLENIELLLPGHMGYISGAGEVKRNFDSINRFFFR